MGHKRTEGRKIPKIKEDVESETHKVVQASLFVIQSSVRLLHKTDMVLLSEHRPKKTSSAFFHKAAIFLRGTGSSYIAMRT